MNKPVIKTYMYDVPGVKTHLFGKVIARNVRAAKRLLRTILKVSALPPKSMVWSNFIKVS